MTVFCAANRTNADAQLSLALAWHRCDMDLDEIFTVENRQYWKVRKNFIYMIQSTSFGDKN